MAKSNTKENLQTTAEALKSLAHPERLAILNLLCNAPNGKLTVKTIYDKLGLQQPIVSRHLAILKSSGVVRRMQEGQKIFYCLCPHKKKIESLLGCFC